MISTIYSKEEESDSSLLSWINLNNECKIESIGLKIRPVKKSSVADMTQYQLHLEKQGSQVCVYIKVYIKMDYSLN